MALKAGIVGLPNVGKSTLFNAITSLHVEAANYPFATISPNEGVVFVPDYRLEYLNDTFKPQRKIAATIEFYDIAGLVKGASQGEGLGNQFLGHIRECSAIVEVVRCFEDKDIIHVEGSVDPIRDIETINLELCLADLATVTKRKGNIETKARTQKDKESVRELNILNDLIDALNKGMPIRALSFKDEDKIFIENNYHLLTNKPIIYVANVSADDYTDLEHASLYNVVKEYAIKEGTTALPISCQIEEELSTLPKDERREFLASLGASESGLDKIVKATYKLLNLSTFFTVGSDECRAWTFKNGQKAPECAGIIHTDFEKGFIKAEIYSFDDLMEYKSEANLKANGKIRMEGKNYVMQDGDIAFFKFNV